MRKILIKKKVNQEQILSFIRLIEITEVRKTIFRIALTRVKFFQFNYSLKVRMMLNKINYVQKLNLESVYRLLNI